MSGGLMGFTSFMPETSYKPEEQIKPGQGYNILRAEHEEVYKETKNKFQELKQPISEIKYDKPLQDFAINDFSRTMHQTYGLNASYYNGLTDNKKEYPYGQEKYIPEAYPNYYYNTHKFSPVYLALNRNG
jgi:hypothetical protein